MVIKKPPADLLKTVNSTISSVRPNCKLYHLLSPTVILSSPTLFYSSPRIRGMMLRSIWRVKIRVVSHFVCPRSRSMSVSSIAAVDMAAKDGKLRVFIVAGEVSGDTIGSRLMASLKQLSPLPVQFSGVGGSLMTQQGLKSLFPMEDISVMGIWELLPHLSNFRVKLKETTEAAVLFQPHVVVTVDSKGYSFRFLKQLHARYGQQGLVRPPHFHYVAPSFWAWKGGEGRLKGLSEFVDHLLCILPFEAEVCRKNGLVATFVGHPIIEDVLELNVCNGNNAWKVQGQSEDFRIQYGISSGATVITLLPGSRLQEVSRMLPIFMETMKLLESRFPELTILIVVAHNKNVENYINEVVHKWSLPVLVIPGGLSTKYNALSASRVALCTSGTVALEMQLARLPCVVAYRAHFLTEWFIRYKAKIPYISLPNILLDASVVPEALFQDCTPPKLASLLVETMHNETLREEQIMAAEKVIPLLCPSESSNFYPSQQKNRPKLPAYTHTPSTIAAFTVLYSVRSN